MQEAWSMSVHVRNQKGKLNFIAQKLVFFFSLPLILQCTVCVSTTVYVSIIAVKDLWYVTLSWLESFILSTTACSQGSKIDSALSLTRAGIELAAAEMFNITLEKIKDVVSKLTAAQEGKKYINSEHKPSVMNYYKN